MIKTIKDYLKLGIVTIMVMGAISMLAPPPVLGQSQFTGGSGATGLISGTVGEPCVSNGNGSCQGTTAQIDVSLIQVAAPSSNSMCAKIKQAVSLFGGVTLDARAITGNQVCEAVDMTQMLGSNTNGTSGKLLLGTVNLLEDGPPFNITATACQKTAGGTATITYNALSGGAAFQTGAIVKVSGFAGGCAAFNGTFVISGVPSTTTLNYSTGAGLVGLTSDTGAVSQTTYTDGNGSTYGTPAILIPNQHLGIYGMGQQWSTISICYAAAGPVPGCQFPFPDRHCSGTTYTAAGNVMTINLANNCNFLNPGTANEAVDGATIWSAALGGSGGGEPVMLRDDTTNTTNNGTWRVLSVPTTTSITVKVPSTVTNCSPCASPGTVWFGTAALGFGPGGSSVAWNAGGTGSNNAFGQRIESLAIGCGTDTGGGTVNKGCIPFINLNGEERSGANWIAIKNYSFIGVALYSKTVQNSGPYENFSTSPASTNGGCDWGTTALYLEDTSTRPIRGWTMTANSCPVHGASGNPRWAVIYDAQTTVFDTLHCEQWSVCMELGLNQVFTSVIMQNITGQPSGGHVGDTAIEISNNFPTSSDYTIMEATKNGSATTLNDQITNCVITDTFIALYAYDRQTGGSNFTSLFSVNPGCVSWMGGNRFQLAAAGANGHSGAPQTLWTTNALTAGVQYTITCNGTVQVDTAGAVPRFIWTGITASHIHTTGWNQTAAATMASFTTNTATATLNAITPITTDEPVYFTTTVFVTANGTAALTYDTTDAKNVAPQRDFACFIN